MPRKTAHTSFGILQYMTTCRSPASALFIASNKLARPAAFSFMLLQNKTIILWGAGIFEGACAHFPGRIDFPVAAATRALCGLVSFYVINTKKGKTPRALKRPPQQQ